MLIKKICGNCKYEGITENNYPCSKCNDEDKWGGVFDLETPGALINQYVNHEGKKVFVVGDLRLHENYEFEYPLLILINSRCDDFVKLSDVSEWVEPKKKIKVAPFIYWHKLAEKFILETEYCTEEKAKSFCELNDYKLHEWPALEPIEVEE